MNQGPISAEDKEREKMRRILVIALALVALMVVILPSCNQSVGTPPAEENVGYYFAVPPKLRGTWTSADATLEAREHNIRISFTQGFNLNMAGIVAENGEAYTIKGEETSLEISKNYGTSGFFFTLTGENLLFEIVGGVEASITFTRQN